MRIAIGHEIAVRRPDGGTLSFAAMWKAYADELGIEADVIEPLRPGALDAIGGYDGFIWRYNFRLPWTDAGPRLMRTIEEDHRIPVWPERILRDIFENKIAQAYLLDAHDIPRPRTWIYWREEDALEALPSLPYPLVAKLSRGMKSDGVALVRGPADARTLVKQMFSLGAQSLDILRGGRARMFGRYTPMLSAMRKGRITGHLEYGYVFLQEFLPGNSFDTRLVVQGDHVCGAHRVNRPGDFRASGSGVRDFDPAAINPKAVELALRLADVMGVRSLIVDILQRGDEPVIGEFSYSMTPGLVRSFRGHWKRGPGGIVRVEEQLDWPRLIFDDFLAKVRDQNARRSS